MAIYKENVVVLYRENDSESYELAEYYALKRDVPIENLISVPCSLNEILDSYADFQNEIENPLKEKLSDPYLSINPLVIIVGYRVPGGFRDGSDIIATSSRLSRINHSYVKGTLNPFYKRQKFARYSDADSELAIISSRIDAPTLDLAKKIIDSGLLVSKQNVVSGKLFLDLYTNINDSNEAEYQNELIEFENDIFPILNIDKYSTTYWDEYKDVVIPMLSNDSFMWSWKADRAGYTFFKEITTPRVFLYNADLDGGEKVRDVDDKRWPMLSLSSGYAATAGAMSDPLPDGFLRPKPFFDSLYRGATIGEAFLFSIPNLDWTISLFGDPLVEVVFPSADVILDSYTRNDGFSVLGRNLQNAISYLFVNEKKAYNVGDDILSSHDVDQIHNIFSSFNSWANSVSSKVGLFTNVINEYYGIVDSPINEYLNKNNLKVSRVLTAISPSGIDNAYKYEKGSWYFEDEIQKVSDDFYLYDFQIQLANDVNFSDLINTGVSYLATDGVILNAASAESKNGWFYEKENSVFYPIPDLGVPSSYIGRRIKYSALSQNYFLERKVYYLRIRQINEFGELSQWRSFKQVVST